MKILYKKISKSVIALIISMLIANLSFSQGIYYGNDTTIYTGDTLKVIANEHRGDIQWQKSYDFTSWSDIEQKVSDTLVYYCDTTIYFRAKITEGTCNSVYSDTVSVSVIALSNETVIIEDSTSTVVSDSTQLENGTYVIEFDGEIPDIKINSVIVGTEGYGFLRKVTGISKNKSTLTLETEDARLTDVIQECNIIDSIKLLINSSKTAYFDGKPIPMKVIYLADGVKLKTKGSGIDLSNRILYSGNVGDYTLTAKITQGSINFEPIFNRELEIQKIPLSVKNLSLSAGGKLDLDMILEVEGNYQGVFSNEITIAQFAFGPIMIGPAPMYIGLSFAAGFETELKTNGIISSGFDATTSVEFGASYNKYAEPKWTRIWERDGKYKQYPVDWGLSAGVHARAYVSPRLSITIGNDPFMNSNASKNISKNVIATKDSAKFISVGPYFELEPYLRFDGTVNVPNWQYELAGGFDGNLGFEISAFGYTITNWDTTLTNWEKIIKEDNGTIMSSWVQKADFGGSARENAVGFSIGNKGYIGTGFEWVSDTKDFWEYDADNDTWTQKADFGGSARENAVGFSIGNKGYIGTGHDGSYYKDFWEYDPDNDTWTQKANFGGSARENAVGFSIGNKGYIGFGSKVDSYSINHYQDFWEYDPATDIWTQKADFGGSATAGSTVGFSIGNKGYIGKGGEYTKDFWEYDPDNDTWTQKADFGGSARDCAVGFSIGNKGYIGTGCNYYGGSSYYKDFWEYDPDTDIWTQKTDFGGYARDYAVGFSIGSKGYIGTGDDGNDYCKDFWEYTPD